MMDVYMTAMLAAIFTVFYAFVQWCSRVTDEQGGRSNGSCPRSYCAAVSVFGLCFDSS